jgi:hypothetical protein
MDRDKAVLDYFLQVIFLSLRMGDTSHLGILTVKHLNLFLAT